MSGCYPYHGSESKEIQRFKIALSSWGEYIQNPASICNHREGENSFYPCLLKKTGILLFAG